MSILLSTLAWGDTGEQQEFFEKKIRPVLVEHCYRCHSQHAETVHGGLRLDDRPSSLAGGDSGAAVVPGDVDASLLISALRYDDFEMPPDGQLPKAIVQDFETWIKLGAHDPREGSGAVTEKAGVDIEAGRDFWAFRPRERHPAPVTKNQDWARNELDRFILSRLESENLAPTADADRATILRRTYFALTGLPPAPQAIDKFVDDPADDATALAMVIDRLLDSPQFGERWGRHWLDVVRFAESSGGGRTLLFPDAWRYRDYVIDAFNQDLPYDQFLTEQIAGDLLPSDDWQLNRRRITATAFMVMGATNYELQDKDVLEMDIIDEQLDTIGKSFLGMTIGCARCHDHKFDPIPTRDYYALAGVLKSTQSVIHDNVSTWPTATLPDSPDRERLLAKHEQQLATLQKRIRQLKDAQEGKAGAGDAIPGHVADDTTATLEGNWKSSTHVGGYHGDRYLVASSADARIVFELPVESTGRYEVWLSYTPFANRSSSVVAQLRFDQGSAKVVVNQQRDGSIRKNLHRLARLDLVAGTKLQVTLDARDAAQGALIADAVALVPEDLVPVDLGPGTLAPATSADRTLPSSDEKQVAAELKQLERQLKQLRTAGPKRDVSMAVQEKDKVGDIPVAIRGVVHNAGPIVPRGVLQVASSEGYEFHVPNNASGRLELANWMSDAQHPLTARVMANRIWHWLFGIGIVPTVDNFGATGAAPTHPKLLDHLAETYVQRGWSTKELIRYIMLSRTYGLSSDPAPDQNIVDPKNHLYWRMNRHRMEAEEIRDSLLSLSGELDLSQGGPSIKQGTKSEYDYEFASLRRAVYVPVFRNTLPDIFAAFDFADPNIQMGDRSESTIAPQALLLMNDEFVIVQSKKAAARLLASSQLTGRAERLDRMYREVLGRKPYASERSAMQRFLRNSMDAERWGMAYQTLIQCVDFRYVR